MVVQALTHPSKRRQGKIHRRTLYIDTDTVFTAYLMAGLILRDCVVPLPATKNAQRVFASHCTDRRGDTLHTHDDGSDIIDKNVMEANTNREIDKRFVQVFLPSEGRFEYLLGDVIASMPGASIVIFDSLNSFYNMYPVSYTESRLTNQSLRKRQQEGDLSERGEPRLHYTIGRLNHLLSIFIMLLVKHGVYYGIPILVTSMVRYRKVSGDMWTKSHAC